jgi:hypothetical protein
MPIQNTNMQQLGTATQAILALAVLSTPHTVSAIPKINEYRQVPIQRVTTRSEVIYLQDKYSRQDTTNSTATNIFNEERFFEEASRQTNEIEILIGEIREWLLFKPNWDGENASAPNTKSLQDAVSFLRLLSSEHTMPESMLHASGNAGLFWNDSNIYADIEFLGDGQIAYFINRNEDKHKGLVKFNSKHIPDVFPAILLAEK